MVGLIQSHQFSHRGTKAQREGDISEIMHWAYNIAGT